MIKKIFIFGIVFLSTMTIYSMHSSLQTALANVRSAVQDLTQALQQPGHSSKPVQRLPQPMYIIESKIGNLEPLSDTRTEFDPFKNVIGTLETTFKKSQPQQFLSTDNKLKKQDGTQFKPGTFIIQTIQQWREQAPTNLKPSVFNVTEAFDKPWEHSFRNKFDIGALQADPRNQEATFQVASNFNGLEGGGDPNQGIMPYLNANSYVQGEAAAISAMPGLIYRMYYVPHTSGNITYQGQLQKQINFLDNHKGITVTNGYISHINNLQQFSGLNENQQQDFIDQVKIGLHTDIQVTGGLGPLKEELPTYKAEQITNPNQTINQVFTATLNLTGKDLAQHEPLARLLLRAAYQGTLYSAMQTSTKKVILTLVGGGVFKNKLSWIIDAIKEAVALTKGLDITLIIFDSKAYPEDEWKKAEEILFEMTRCTGGNYTRYKKDGIYKLEASQTPGSSTSSPVSSSFCLVS